jgi:uncharacterized protein YecE (DUF72 family)
MLIGCAGWAIPRADAEAFPGSGSHLERYAARFGAAEINSSFHRPHRPATYARWRDSVPESFRFSVKLPKAITHVDRLVDASQALDAFLAEAGHLEEKLGCLLVQLPPSLAFDAMVAGGFFAGLRDRFAGAAACEPRHPSWFAADSDELLAAFQIARVAADPARVPAAAAPGGWQGLIYHRLHGSPRMYYSTYPEEYLDRLAAQLTAETAAGVPVWCIFDNTAAGAATANALSLLQRL